MAEATNPTLDERLEKLRLNLERARNQVRHIARETQFNRERARQLAVLDIGLLELTQVAAEVKVDEGVRRADRPRHEGIGVESLINGVRDV